MKEPLFLIIITLILSGCTSFTELKAPCDQYGTGCGQKISINQN